MYAKTTSGRPHKKQRLPPGRGTRGWGAYICNIYCIYFWYSLILECVLSIFLGNKVIIFKRFLKTKKMQRIITAPISQGCEEDPVGWFRAQPNPQWPPSRWALLWTAVLSPLICGHLWMGTHSSQQLSWKWRPFLLKVWPGELQYWHHPGAG